ncbi:peptidoglycan-associated lipoprotein Pal [Acidobacteriota bacterium]
MAKRCLLLLFLATGIVLAFGCGSKPPPVILDDDQPGDRESGMDTEYIEPEPEPSPYVEEGIDGNGLMDDEGEKLLTVYFDFDKYELKQKARNRLNDNARYLRENRDVTILLGGHCDDRGTKEYNLALGDRRANTVYRYLVDLGIDPRRLKTISYGEEYPAIQGQSEGSWAKNRRVEFKVVE